MLQAGCLVPSVDQSARFRIQVGEGASNVTKFSSGADYVAATDDAVYEGVVAWGRYERTISFAKDAMVALKNGNPAALTDFGNMLTIAMEDVARKINQDLYDGTGSNSVIGLDTAIAASGTAYAGLQDTQGWEGNLVTSTGAFALDDLRTLQASVATAKGRRIGRGDIWVCDPDTYNTWDVAQAEEEGRRQVLLVGDARANEGGLEGLVRDGAAVIEDPDCPALKAFGLSLRDVQLRYLSPDASLVDGKGNAPFFWVERAFTGQGHFNAWNVSAYVQLIVPRRSAHGKYTFASLS